MAILKNILIIPAFYPTEKNHLLGTFFKEQSDLVTGLYKINVVYPLDQMVSLFRYIIIKKIYRKNSFSVNEELFNPNGFVLNILQIRKSLIFKIIGKNIEEINQNIKIASLEKYLNIFLDSKFMPDLIHAHCTIDAGITAYHLANRLGIPYVITEHNYFLLNELSTFKKSEVKKTLENANYVLVVSAFLKKVILMNSINCYPLIIGNLVNEKKINKVRNEINLFKKFNVITYSYNSWKNDIDTLFKVFILSKFYKEVNIKFTLIVATYGGDIDKLFFLNLIEKNNLVGIVDILFDVPREKVSSYLSDADLYLSCSLVETFGITPCEALCCGLPIVCSDNGGCDEYLNSSNGIKVESRNPQKLLNAIIEVFNNYQNYVPIILRSQIIEKYGIDSFQSKICRIYNRLL